jgi:hypothetical protein
MGPNLEFDRRDTLVLWRQKKVALFGTSKNTRFLGLTVTLQKEYKKENPLGFPADDAFEGPSCFCRALGLKDSHIKQKKHQSCIGCLHVVEVTSVLSTNTMQKQREKTAPWAGLVSAHTHCMPLLPYLSTCCCCVPPLHQPTAAHQSVASIAAAITATASHHRCRRQPSVSSVGKCRIYQPAAVVCRRCINPPLRINPSLPLLPPCE